MSYSMQISCEVHDAGAGVETVLWTPRWTLDSIWLQEPLSFTEVAFLKLREGIEDHMPANSIQYCVAKRFQSFICLESKGQYTQCRALEAVLQGLQGLLCGLYE